MSKNILFISENKFKENSFLSDNVDPKQLLPTIKAVQDRYIHHMLGTALYTKLQTLITAGTVPTGPYKTLLDDYITDTLIWYTLAQLPIPLQLKLVNKGVVTRTGDTIQTASSADTQTLMEYCDGYAQWYAQRTIDYLCQNYTLYPEYQSPGSGADTIHPDRTQYHAGIFLGGICPDRGSSLEERYQGDNPHKHY